MSAANPSHHPCHKDKAIANYRRNFLFGGSYFFAANLAGRRLGLLTEHIALLRVAFRQVRARHPFMKPPGSVNDDGFRSALNPSYLLACFHLAHGNPRDHDPTEGTGVETSQSELYGDRSFDRGNIFLVQAADPLPQAKLADRAQLIGHCLACSPLNLT